MLGEVGGFFSGWNVVKNESINAPRNNAQFFFNSWMDTKYRVTRKVESMGSIRASPKCYECPKKHTGYTILFHSIKLKLFKIQLSGFSLALFDFGFRKKVKINH